MIFSLRSKLLCAAMMLMACVPCLAQMNIFTVSDNAFNGYINGVSFQQDAITTYNGYQYAVYWSANRHVAVARKSMASDEWQTLELKDYRFEVDNAHYDISLGVSPRDGSLHLSFYQWSSVFNYRKSVPDVLNAPERFTWDSSVFGPLQNGLQGSIMQPTTYPRFVTEPSGKLLLLLRHGESGAGDSYLYEYDGNNGDWTGLGKLVDGLATDINAYFNGLHYDARGRLHASWVWRASPDATTNFDLHYIYSDDDGRTWYNNGGAQIAVTGQAPITQSTEGTRVWNIAQNRGLINQEAQAIDGDGRVSMLMSHMPDAQPDSTNFGNNRLKARVFHYLRDLDGRWTRTMLPGSSFSFDRNKIAADSHNNLYAIINRDGIYRATQAGQWRDWQLLYSLTDQSVFAEVQMDRQRLFEQNILSFMQVSNTGRMFQYEYTPAKERSLMGAVGGGPEGYEFCAFEGETCRFTGRHDVVYGRNGRFHHQFAEAAIACSGEEFGDPVRGTVKACYVSVSQAENGAMDVPMGYAFCAEEGALCNVNETRNVAYGGDGAFHYRLVQGPISCTQSEFGEVQNAGVKRCYEYIIPSVDTPPGNEDNESNEPPIIEPEEPADEVEEIPASAGVSSYSFLLALFSLILSGGICRRFRR